MDVAPSQRVCEWNVENGASLSRDLIHLSTIRSCLQQLVTQLCRASFLFFFFMDVQTPVWLLFWLSDFEILIRTRDRCYCATILFVLTINRLRETERYYKERKAAMLHYDPTVGLPRAPSRSVSQATSRAATIDERLRVGEEQWKSRLSADHQRRQEALQKARYLAEQRQLRAAEKLSAEEAESAAVRRKHAQVIEMQIHRQRANSAAMSHRVNQLRQMEQVTAERKLEDIQEKLAASSINYSRKIEDRQQHLAQQRALRDALVEANQRKLDRSRSVKIAKIESEQNTPSRARSASTTSGSVSHNARAEQLRIAQERSSFVEQSRLAYTRRKLEEEEMRTQQAIARRQNEIEQRRQQKAAREAQSKMRVQLCERQREMLSRRYEREFQEAVDVGNRVAAYNSICRLPLS